MENFNKSSSCTCENYSALELDREHISKRIKESKEIIKYLDKKSESPQGHHLYQCVHCMQFWQLSSAWNWGGKDYLFQVPNTEISEWTNNHFMSPSEMMIHFALLKTYFEKNKMNESERDCRRENCVKKALQNDVLCKIHFIESLQKIGQLPKSPSGKFFEPYTFDH